MKRMLNHRLTWLSVLVLCNPLIAAAQGDGTKQQGSDPVTVITAILIASFAIERIVTGLLTFLSSFKPLAGIFRNPSSPGDKATTARKVAYFALAGVLSWLVIVGFGKEGVFTRLSFTDPKTNPMGRALDIAFTWLILVAGSDRIAELLRKMGRPASGAKEKQPPLEIVGKVLMVEEQAGTQEAAKPERRAAKDATAQGS